jgi:hypothetical protein
MNKFILSLILLLISSASFANCSINYIGTSNIQDLIKTNKFEFDGYNKLCERLKNNNAGVVLTGITQISPYQTTAAVIIGLYPIGEKYKGTTLNTVEWIGYDELRTSKTEKDRLYSLTMYALDNLSKPEYNEKLKAMLNEVIEIRKGTK